MSATVKACRAGFMVAVIFPITMHCLDCATKTSSNDQCMYANLCRKRHVTWSTSKYIKNSTGLSTPTCTDKWLIYASEYMEHRHSSFI